MTADRRHTAESFPRRRSLWIAFLLAPAAVVMVAVRAVAAALGLPLSFYEFNGLRPADFIGFENFRQVLFEQPYSDWTYNAF